MKVTLWILGFIASTNLFAQSVDLLWLKTYESSNYATIEQIESDSQGDLILSGSFMDDVDIDPGPSIEMVSGSRSFIQKTNNDGNLIWSKPFLSTENVFISDLDIDSQGNIFLSGEFSGTVDFDLGNGVSVLTSNGLNDGFLVKLNSLGDLIWAKQIGSTTGAEIIRKIAIDNNDNVIVSGSFSESCDLDPGVGTSIITPLGWDSFILKLNTNGTLIWNYHIPSKNRVVTLDIKTDINNDVVIVGSFIDTTFFDGSNSVYPEQIPYIEAGFILKLTANGQFEWVNHYSSEAKVVECIQSEIYVAGWFTGEINFGNNPSDTLSTTYTSGYLQKLDSQGNNVWVKAFHSESCLYFTDIAHNSIGDIFLTGSIHGRTDFDPDPQNELIVDPSYNDGNGTMHESFLLKVNANGEFKWLKNLIASNTSNTLACEVDLYNNVFASGEFYSICDFGNGYSNMISTGIASGFFFKIGPTAGLIDNSGINTIHLYPNPVRDILSVQFENETEVSYAISDQNGRLMIIGTLNPISNKIDLTHFSHGVYYMQFRHGNENAVFKIFKQ